MKHLAIVSLFTLSLMGASPEVTQYMQELESIAKAEDKTFGGFDAVRGKEIFTSTHIGKNGKPMPCSANIFINCGVVRLTLKPLMLSNLSTLTGKVIDPLSPRTNPQRLTSAKEVKKWLKRNFMDVYAREGTAREKGDVLAYIIKN